MYNETIYALRTFTHVRHEDGNKIVTTLKAEIHSLGNQAPYFALTHKETDNYSRRRNDLSSCGVASMRQVELFKDSPEYPLLVRVLGYHLRRVTFASLCLVGLGNDMRALFPGLSFDSRGNLRPLSIVEPETSEDDSLATILARAGVTMRVKAIDQRKDGLMNDGTMTHWLCELRLNGRHMQSYYSMGSAYNGRKPNIEDVVGSLVTESADYTMSSDEIAREFGYSARQARKLSDAIVRNTDNLRALLGDELFSNLTGLD